MAEIKTKQRLGVKLSRDVKRRVKQLQRLNVGWLKAGCWTMESEKPLVRDGQVVAMVPVERQIRLPKKPKVKVSSRLLGHMPDSAVTAIKIRGKPGTQERVEALAAHYNDPSKDEDSPFEVTRDDCGRMLANIFAAQEARIEGGSERVPFIEGMQKGSSHGPRH